MVLGITYDFHPAAAFCHYIALRYGSRSVVGALGMDVWADFADKCAHNANQCSSVYDLNHDGITDSADLLIIEANLGRRCGPLGFLP